MTDKYEQKADEIANKSRVQIRLDTFGTGGTAYVVLDEQICKPLIAAALRQAREDALEEAANVCETHYRGFITPYEYNEKLQDEIRALKEQGDK